MQRFVFTFYLVVAVFAPWACGQRHVEAATPTTAAVQASAAPVVARPEVAPDPRLGQVDLTPAASAGSVAEGVKAELSRAAGQHRRLVVYVGATWCEPCQRFHDAAAKGQLDDQFPTLRLLEFDLDRDGDRLQASGYHSNLIPLFSIPRTDGRASEFSIEGSIKGDGAVDNLVPRLAQLLKQQNADKATDVTRPLN